MMPSSSSSAAAANNATQSPGLKTYFKTPEGRFKLQYEKTHPAGLIHYAHGKTTTQVFSRVSVSANSFWDTAHVARLLLLFFGKLGAFWVNFDALGKFFFLGSRLPISAKSFKDRNHADFEPMLQD